MVRRIHLAAAASVFMAAMVGGTGLATAVSAQVVPQPAIGDPRPLAVPATEDYQLANGIRVTLVPYPVVPKTVIQVAVAVGNNDDGANIWLSDLTVMMMREGAGSRSGSELSQAFADMGGVLSTNVGRSYSRFATNVLTERSPEALALIADVVRRPTLPDEAFGRIKEGMERNRAINISSPSGQAMDAYARTLFAGHPYADALPAEGQIRAISLDTVRGFHASSFGPKGAHIYVGGQFDPVAIKAAIEQAFGDWSVDNNPAVVPKAPAVTRRVVLVDRPGALQTNLQLVVDAAPVGTDDHIRQEVMNSLLGGSFNSRITTNIREDKGYTYSPFSTLTVFDRQTTHWTQNADVTAANTGDSVREILNEIERLQREAPTEAETRGTRNMSTGSFLLSMSTTNGVVNGIITLDDQGLPRDYYDRYIPAVGSVTAEDIQKAAREIDLSRMALIVVGDLASVRPQLEALPQLKDFTFEVFEP